MLGYEGMGLTVMWQKWNCMRHMLKKSSNTTGYHQVVFKLNSSGSSR